MNWKNKFAQQTLEKAYTYYEYDALYDIKYGENSISAKIDSNSTEPYKIKVTFNNNKIKSMECTCIEHKNNPPCKHIASLLYKYEEIKENTEDDEKITQFEEILYSLDEITLKEYLVKRFKYDYQFCEEFINHFQEDITSDDVVEMENTIMEMFQKTNDYDYNLDDDLYFFINSKIDLLCKLHEYQYTANMIYMIYHNISQYNAYDNLYYSLRALKFYLNYIIDHSRLKDREIIFNKAIKCISNMQTPVVALIEFISKKYYHERYLREILNSIDDLIESDKITEELLMLRYDFLMRLNYPLEDLKSFLYDYKHYKSILLALVKVECRNSNYSSAIELLEKAENMDVDNQLIQVYQKASETTKLVEKTKQMIYDRHSTDIKYYLILKEYMDEEGFILEKERIINYYLDKSAYETVNEIYIIEEDYDKLFYNIIDNCTTSTLEEHRKYYENSHRTEILDYYEKIIYKDSLKANNIASYNYIIKLLKSIDSYDATHERLRKIISNLKNKYPQKKEFILK